jgi:hypothetical protein
MRNLIRIFVVAASVAIGFSAGAQIVLGPTPMTFIGQSGGTNTPFDLTITYTVTKSGSSYLYSYSLTTTPLEQLLSFTLGGVTDPVDTQGLAITDLGQTDGALDGVTANSVVFGWDANADVTSDTVGFTSPLAPGFATFTLNGDDILWTSPPPIPAPVPEASTFFAGAIMLLPFGIGAFRAIRKHRQP